LNPFQEEARWLLAAALDRQDLRRAARRSGARARSYEATYTRMHIAHASIGPSCGLALYGDGHLQVWTHCRASTRCARHWPAP